MNELIVFTDPRYRLWFALSLLLTLLAAFFATGYHHPDEYMQIVEFANLKLGGRGAHDLPWEYHETMRPWLQPGLFFLLVKALRFIGIENPFLTISIFRLLLGLLGWAAMILMAEWVVRNTKEAFVKTAGVFLCAFLFYLPWLFTRTSSESLSSSLLMMAVFSSLLFRKFQWQSCVLLALACLTRYQVCFAALGFILWQVFQNQNKHYLTKFFVVALFASALELALGSWGYEKLAFAPFHYLYQNVVLNKSAQWGVDPFWYYPVLLQKHGMPLISLPLTLAFFFACIKIPRSPFVWTAIPFFLAHSMIGHKELRFLFPLAVFAPVYFVQTLTRLQGATWMRKRVLVKPFLFLNIVSLVFLCLWPSRTEVLVQKKLWSMEQDSWLVKGYHPYILGDHPIYFVRPENLKIEIAEQVQGMVVATEKIEGCELLWSAIPEANYPDWLEKAIQRARPYRLYDCSMNN